MAFQATVYRVLIASPGDVNPEREVIETAIADWNNEHAEDRAVMFLATRWERASPRGGTSGQGVINEDLVSNSDVLVGVFWTKIGSKTQNDKSGSIEEIRQFAESGRHYGLFFKNGDLPYDHDRTQFASLTEFKAEVHSVDSPLPGLTRDFSTADELRRYIGPFLTNAARRLKPPVIDDRVGRPEVKPDEDAGRSAEAVMAQRENEAYGLAAATAAKLDRQALGPLQSGLDEQDMSRKACLVIEPGKVMTLDDVDEIQVVKIINEGEYRARDVKVWWDRGSGFGPEPEDTAWDVIHPAKLGRHGPRTLSLRIARPDRDGNGNAQRGQEKIVRLRLTFQDGMDQRDEATFTIQLHNNKDMGTSWTQVEDTAAARVSRLCRFTRPGARHARSGPNPEFNHQGLFATHSDSEETLFMEELRRQLDPTEKIRDEMDVSAKIRDEMDVAAKIRDEMDVSETLRRLGHG